MLLLGPYYSIVLLCLPPRVYFCLQFLCTRSLCFRFLSLPTYNLVSGRRRRQSRQYGIGPTVWLCDCVAVVVLNATEWRPCRVPEPALRARFGVPVSSLPGPGCAPLSQPAALFNRRHHCVYRVCSILAWWQRSLPRLQVIYDSAIPLLGPVIFV